MATFINDEQTLSGWILQNHTAAKISSLIFKFKMAGKHSKLNNMTKIAINQSLVGLATYNSIQYHRIDVTCLADYVTNVTIGIGTLKFFRNQEFCYSFSSFPKEPQQTWCHTYEIIFFTSYQQFPTANIYIFCAGSHTIHPIYNLLDKNQFGW
jgi:hypothetical protein